jgi:hypothetical protein
MIIFRVLRAKDVVEIVVEVLAGQHSLVHHRYLLSSCGNGAGFGGRDECLFAARAQNGVRKREHAFWCVIAGGPTSERPAPRFTPPPGRVRRLRAAELRHVNAVTDLYPIELQVVGSTVRTPHAFPLEACARLDCECL